MASFENMLFTLQANMVSLANRVSTIETCYSLSTVPRVAATLSTGTSAQATRHPLPTAASQVLGTPSSVSDVFYKLHLRDLKKQYNHNWIVN